MSLCVKIVHDFGEVLKIFSMRTKIQKIIEQQKCTFSIFPVFTGY